jgi:transcription termination/antitermination protein NusG
VTEEANKPIDESTLPQEDQTVQGEATEVLEGSEPASPAKEASVEAEVSPALPTDGVAEADTPPEADAADTTEAVASAEEVSEKESVEEEADEPVSESAEPEAAADEVEEERNMDWYILKVQSNREDSIRDGLIRRVKIAGLEDYFGEVIVPTEKVTEFKGGKKRVTKRKLYPGYIVVNMEINDDTWFLVRETPGIGDFTGAAGTPTPMLPHEVQRILAKTEEKQDEVPKLKIGFHVGDRVKINEGTFENFEGEVSKIDETSGHVEVMINIFGRSTPVELEYWQIESV